MCKCTYMIYDVYFVRKTWISAKSFRKVMRAMPSLANGQGLQWLQGAVAKWCGKTKASPKEDVETPFLMGKSIFGWVNPEAKCEKDDI